MSEIIAVIRKSQPGSGTILRVIELGFPALKMEYTSISMSTASMM